VNENRNGLLVCSVSEATTIDLFLAREDLEKEEVSSWIDSDRLPGRSA
jgi:hypothetical protein